MFLVLPGDGGRAFLDLLRFNPSAVQTLANAKKRHRTLRRLAPNPTDGDRWYVAATGATYEWHGSGPALFAKPIPERKSGGVLTARVKSFGNVNGWDLQDLIFEWR